ncbi:YhcN/YlaJ family sporulation lipoprotein [Rossellomorea aquimaris]|uniref:YhcN/YlaJ family sporulation lipoprotein n=1 Tax=Rossellomorea aquimaris TaxID=189382 RepID=UPI0009EE555C|nr:YhcN/YlaJ family sporulation lipoprotein [Rossellomorea aquimaris]
MKKYVFTALIGVLFLGIVSGCGTNDNMNEQGLNENNRDLQNVKYNNNQGNRDYVNYDGEMVEENYSISDKAANKVATLNQVESAYVLTTKRNAYVAAVLEDRYNGEINNELEKKIADSVRSVDPGIQNVYVSTNPDFIDSMRDYANKADQGKPIKGLGEEMADMLKRVFPNRK